MIVNIYGVPYTSLLEVISICDQLGVQLGYLSRSSPQFKRIAPSRRLYFGPLRVMYSSDIPLINEYMDHMQKSHHHYSLLINGAMSHLVEYGVEVHKVPFTVDDLMQDFIRKPQKLGPLSQKRDLNKEIFDRVNRDSLLSKLQTSIYRVQDKVDRTKAQGTCYAYLGGSIKKRPSTGYPYLDNILSSDLAGLFCKATREVKAGNNIDVVAEKHGLDRFEIAFILKRIGHDFD